MSLNNIFNSDKLYAIANLIFAGSNAIISILVVKFFGVRVYGFMTYYNSIDMFIDYLSGHSRSTFEYSAANTSNHERIIQSFAIIQLLLSFFSAIFFFILSFYTVDPISLFICQIFIIFSPGKSYLNFFRILSKVTGKLKWFTFVVTLISVLNLIFITISNFFFDFYIYMLLRSVSLVCFIVFLIRIFSLNLSNVKNRFYVAYVNLRSKSKSLIIYSFITLMTIALDKLIIKNMFDATILGIYGVAFLAYNMLVIFSGSLIGGNFRKLTSTLIRDYTQIISKTLFWTIFAIIIIEIFIILFNDFLFLENYNDSIRYLKWLFPAATVSVFIQISYIYLISNDFLNEFNFGYLFITILFLISSITLSFYTQDILWFAFSFFSHQIFIVYFLSYKFRFLKTVFLKCFSNNKISFFSLFIIHALFIYFNI